MTKGRPRITLRLSADQIDQLKQIATERGLSVSDIIRDLIESFLTENE